MTSTVISLRTTPFFPDVGGSDHEEGSIVKAKILSFVTLAWLKYWMRSLVRVVSWVCVIANLSHTRTALTVARVLAVAHFLEVDNPMSVAFSTIASSAVLKVAVVLVFQVVGSALPGVVFELVGDISD